MKLHFLFENSSDAFEAECEGSCTAKTATQGMIDAGFLVESPRGYGLILTRTNTTIPPNTTFAAAGVQDGDQIQVLHQKVGA